MKGTTTHFPGFHPIIKSFDVAENEVTADDMNDGFNGVLPTSDVAMSLNKSGMVARLDSCECTVFCVSAN